MLSAQRTTSVKTANAIQRVAVASGTMLSAQRTTSVKAFELKRTAADRAPRLRRVPNHVLRHLIQLFIVGRHFAVDKLPNVPHHIENPECARTSRKIEHWSRTAGIDIDTRNIQTAAPRKLPPIHPTRRFFPLLDSGKPLAGQAAYARASRNDTLTTGWSGLSSGKPGGRNPSVSRQPGSN